MKIKNSFLRFIFLLISFFTICIIINQIFVNDTLIFSIPHDTRIISKESPASTISPEKTNVLSQTSNLSLLGKLEIDEGIKDWSTIEAANSVSVIYKIALLTNWYRGKIHSHDS